MARFVLTVLEDGSAIFSTEEVLSENALKVTADAFGRWRREPNSVIVLGETRIEFAKAMITHFPTLIDLPVEAS